MYCLFQENLVNAGYFPELCQHEILMGTSEFTNALYIFFLSKKQQCKNLNSLTNQRGVF